MEKENLRIKMENEAKEIKEKLHAENNERSKSNANMKMTFDKEKAEIESRMLREQEKLQEKFQLEQMKRMEKEKEMQAKMEQSKESSNELIELFDKVKKELAARKKENEDLRQLLSEETESLFVNLSRGNSEVRDLLERERDELARRLEDQRHKSVMLEQQLAHNR